MNQAGLPLQLQRAQGLRFFRSGKIKNKKILYDIAEVITGVFSIQSGKTVIFPRRPVQIA